MTSTIFTLTNDQEFIQLNSLLKLLQIAQTGGHAKLMIQNEEVQVNGLVETRVRKKLFNGDIVVVNNTSIRIQ